MHKIALIKENGEVANICSTQVDDMYVDGQTYGDLLAKHLPLDADNQEYINCRYWDYEGNQWQTRQSRTGGYMVWVDNAWVLDSEILFAEVRQYRDSYLLSCDWTQMADSPLSDSKKAEWTTYRQALRDVPANNSDATDLSDIIWPTKPE